MKRICKHGIPWESHCPQCECGHETTYYDRDGGAELCRICGKLVSLDDRKKLKDMP